MQIKNTKKLISRIRKRERERKIVECNKIFQIGVECNKIKVGK